jgi:hypothetical protein
VTVLGQNGQPQQIPVVRGGGGGAPPTDYSKNPNAAGIRSKISEERAAGKTPAQIQADLAKLSPAQKAYWFPGGDAEIAYWIKAASPAAPLPVAPRPAQPGASAIPGIAPIFLPGR